MSFSPLSARLIDRIGRVLHRTVPRDTALWRLLRRVRGRLPRTPPKQQIGQLLDAFGQDWPRAVVIQIGANDGAQHDPLRIRILRHQWQGYLLEPVPYVFARLENYYADIDRIQPVNIAIADCDGHKDFHHLRQADPDEQLPRWYDGIGSFQRDVLLSHRDRIPDIERRLITTPVPCLRFDSFCERFGITAVNLIQMDTEGYDYEVIKLIDLARWQPLLLMYEHRHLSAEDRAACLAHMQAAGYETMQEGLDTLCLHARAAAKEAPKLYALWQQIQKGERGG